MFSLLFAAALALFSPPPERGGADQWTTGGPHGGFIGQIVVDPLSTAVYALSGSIYKTMDSGRHWTSLAALPDSSSAYRLAADPTQANHLLAVNTSGNTSGIARTTDGGKTWSQVVNDSHIFRVSFDPSRPNVAYAASASSVLYRSLDDGVSWSMLHPPIEAGFYVFDLAVSGGGTLFVALSSTLGYSLLRSADKGDSWSPGVFPPSTSYLYSLIADPVVSQTVYAATSQGLFRSDNGGDSWTRRGGGVATSLAIDPRDSATLYAGNQSTVYPPNNGGVWKSTDSGVTWKMSAIPLPPFADVLSLTIGPMSSALWVGTRGDGVFLSPDAGTNWIEIGDGLPGPPVTAIAADPTTPATVYAGTYSGSVARVHRSEDAGERWAPVFAYPGDPFYPGTVPQFRELAVDAGAPKTIYAATTYCLIRKCLGDIFKTTNGGLSWSALGFGGPVTAMAIDPAVPDTLYASTYAFLNYGYGYKSIDGGSNWTVLGGSFPTAAVSQWLIDPAPPATVYVATCETGVFASTDAGATWSARNNGLTDLCDLSLARDPVNARTLYVGTQTGIFKSTDAGMSWAPTGFTKDARALVVDPRNPATLFVGTWQTGVFRSTDGGASWMGLNEGLSNLEIQALAMDSAGAYLHAATNAGVFDLKLRRLIRVVGPRQ